VDAGGGSMIRDVAQRRPAPRIEPAFHAREV
jgi:hypothetical protein